MRPLRKLAAATTEQPPLFPGLEPAFAALPADLMQAQEAYRDLAAERAKIQEAFSAACREAHGAGANSPTTEMRQIDKQIVALDAKVKAARAALSDANTLHAEAMYDRLAPALRAAETEIEDDLSAVLAKLEKLCDVATAIRPGNAAVPLPLTRAPAFAAGIRAMLGQLWRPAQ